VAFHTRWLLETLERHIPAQPRLRFAGGGARSPVWAQILADVLGREIEVVAEAHQAGAAGAAIVTAIGLGLVPDFAHARKLVRVGQRFVPRPEHRPLYDRLSAVYRKLHPRNRALFRMLNEG
jgi:xylulokinase